MGFVTFRDSDGWGIIVPDRNGTKPLYLGGHLKDCGLEGSDCGCKRGDIQVEAIHSLDEVGQRPVVLK